MADNASDARAHRQAPEPNSSRELSGELQGKVRRRPQNKVQLLGVAGGRVRGDHGPGQSRQRADRKDTVS